MHFQEGPEPLLYMPYYPLGSLEDLAVEPRQHVSAFHQMLLGLRHLHRRGIVHRDLKPSNLLVAKERPFTIVISDFGFSKHVTGNALLRTFCGTRLYAAPEVVPDEDGPQGYRSSVDVWSAGIIVLELIFGRPNHKTINHLPLQDWIKAWSNIAIRQVYELDENDDQIIDLVKHMVVKQPENRFSADQCLQRGYNNGLFEKRMDDQVISDSSKDSIIEIDTETESETAARDTNTSDEPSSDDGIATPTQPGLRGKNATFYAAPLIPSAELGGSGEHSKQASSGATQGLAHLETPETPPWTVSSPIKGIQCIILQGIFQLQFSLSYAYWEMKVGRSRIQSTTATETYI